MLDLRCLMLQFTLYLFQNNPNDFKLNCFTVSGLRSSSLTSELESIFHHQKKVTV